MLISTDKNWSYGLDDLYAADIQLLFMYNNNVI